MLETCREEGAQPFGCLLALVLCNVMYSGWMLSTPGALLVFRRWVACSISGVVKSVDRLELHPGALDSSWTVADVFLAKSLSAFVKWPLLSRSDAMEFAVMGHCTGVVDLPVSLLQLHGLPRPAAGVCEVNCFHSLCPSLPPFLVKSAE